MTIPLNDPRTGFKFSPKSDTHVTYICRDPIGRAISSDGKQTKCAEQLVIDKKRLKIRFLHLKKKI